MTVFHDVQFPSDISYGSSGGPQYSTDIIITNSGHEQRNINWAESRSYYNIVHGVKTKDQMDILIEFFRARKGRAYGFRFKDWSDYDVVGQNIGVGGGVQSVFALKKTYTNGGAATDRAITKPVDNSVSIYVDNMLVSSGVTVDYTSGQVTFDAAPDNGAVIAADFEFDVPVRFDTDRLSASLDSYGVHSWGNIPLVEVRV